MLWLATLLLFTPRGFQVTLSVIAGALYYEQLSRRKCPREGRIQYIFNFDKRLGFVGNCQARTSGTGRDFDVVLHTLTSGICFTIFGTSFNI
jgi:hypothetical protein